MHLSRFYPRAALARLAFLGITAPQPLRANWVLWSSAVGGNDHEYQAVSVSPGINWASAQAAAAAQGAHLATLTSPAENAFVFALIDFPEFWVDPLGTSNFGPWVGGVQPPGSSEPAGGWSWVTGEPFAYTNWFPGEPNNFLDLGGNEDRIHFFDVPNVRGPRWNDLAGSNLLGGYVMERPAGFIPEPSTLTLMLSGLVTTTLLLRTHGKSRGNAKGEPCP